jgi:hypothetical protein
MPAVAASPRCRQVFVEADVHRAGNVPGKVLLVPPRLVLEIVSAVDDDPRLVQV